VNKSAEHRAKLSEARRVLTDLEEAYILRAILTGASRKKLAAEYDVSRQKIDLIANAAKKKGIVIKSRCGGDQYHHHA